MTVAPQRIVMIEPLRPEGHASHAMDGMYRLMMQAFPEAHVTRLNHYHPAATPADASSAEICVLPPAGEKAEAGHYAGPLNLQLAMAALRPDMVIIERPYDWNVIRVSDRSGAVRSFEVITPVSTEAGAQSEALVALAAEAADRAHKPFIAVIADDAGSLEPGAHTAVYLRDEPGVMFDKLLEAYRQHVEQGGRAA